MSSEIEIREKLDKLEKKLDKLEKKLNMISPKPPHVRELLRKIRAIRVRLDGGSDTPIIRFSLQ